MAAIANKLSTPALIPWMPPGKPKESSSNVLVHKKNSGSYDYGSSIASSTVFNQPNKKKVSLEPKFWSPKKNSRKLTLGADKERRIETLLKSSVNSQAEQDLLRNKIRDIFDETEENEKEMEDKKNGAKKRHNSDPERRSRKEENQGLDVNNKKDQKDRERSRSRSKNNEKEKSHRHRSRSDEKRNKTGGRSRSRSISGRRRKKDHIDGNIDNNSNTTKQFPNDQNNAHKV